VAAKRVPIVLLLAAVLTAMIAVPAVPAATASAGPRAGRAAALPQGSLFGVAATSPRNAWAVGQTLTGNSIVLHWGGGSWKRVASPTPKGGGALFGVAATSPGIAWAVGGSDNAPYRTEILHWNGRTWGRMATPAVAGALFAVAASSARNAWAVGCAGDCYQGFGTIKTLILHWNGKSWKRVPSPSPGLGSSLAGVSVPSGSAAWAVGCTADCFISSAKPQTLILHWDGSKWTQAPAVGVGALTAANLTWAVGCTGHCFGPGANPGTLIASWNGTFRRVPSPSPAGGSVLAGVSAVNFEARNAWAVGYTRASGKTLIVHWNGSSWAKVASPTPKGGGELVGVAAPAANSAFAVGSTLTGNLLLLHWNGTTWK
jgi:hypothetical protein